MFLVSDRFIVSMEIDSVDKGVEYNGFSQLICYKNGYRFAEEQNRTRVG